MTTFLLALAVLLTIVVIMSVGVLMGRTPIKGSCGGMSALGMETECDVCGGDKGKCEKEQEQGTDDVAEHAQSDQFYSATDAKGSQSADK